MKVLLAVKRTVGLIFFFIFTAVSEPGCVQLADMDVDLGGGAALRPIIGNDCIWKQKPEGKNDHLVEIRKQTRKKKIVLNEQGLIHCNKGVGVTFKRT